DDQRTFIPTFNDRFDGGDGQDRVLFLGGDLDAQGRVVPDNVAVRYNTILHRYEVTAQVWNEQTQRFAVVDGTDVPLQHYAFFQVGLNAGQPTVEQFHIDTRRGDDVVHADPEHLINGSEWGIDPQDAPQRASLSDLVIIGGGGNDRLFGGAGADIILGGAGLDVIRGGGGNDDIDGGADADWIAGGPNEVVPDVYEIPVGAASGTASNDLPGSAAFIDVDYTPLLSGGSPAIPDVNFHLGDTQDWYVIPAPPAYSSVGLRSFDAASSAQLVRDMLSVEFFRTDGNPDPRAQEFFGLTEPQEDSPPIIESDVSIQLFAAVDTDPGAPLSVEPVTDFAGVPDYYLVRIVNPNSLAVFGSDRVQNFALVNDQGGGLEARFTVTHVRTGSSNEVILKDTSNLSSMQDLITHVQVQIDDSDLGSDSVHVGQIDGRLAFWSQDGTDISVTTPNTSAGEVANTELHLPEKGRTVFNAGLEIPDTVPTDRVTTVPKFGHTYTLRFNGDEVQGPVVGGSVNLGAESAAASISPTNAADRPVVISVGDINGDGYDDFIGHVFDTTTSSEARLYFGGDLDGGYDPTQQSVTLHLPAPVLVGTIESTNPASLRSLFTHGDFNADGLSDLVVATSGVTNNNNSVSILLGRNDAFDIVAARDGYAWTSDATFRLRFDGTTLSGPVTLDRTQFTNLQSLQSHVNAALADAGLSSQVEAVSVENRLRLRLLSGSSVELVLQDPLNNPLQTELGFNEGQKNAWHMSALIDSSGNEFERQIDLTGLSEAIDFTDPNSQVTADIRITSLGFGPLSTANGGDALVSVGISAISNVNAANASLTPGIYRNISGTTNGNGTNAVFTVTVDPGGTA
ncbi:MAG: hypothetical protein ABGZ17_29265, partial [Planctomycetaceae bacterium]